MIIQQNRILDSDYKHIHEMWTTLNNKHSDNANSCKYKQTL